MPSHGSGETAFATISHDVNARRMQCAASHRSAPDKPICLLKPQEFQRLITGFTCLRLLYVPRDIHASGLGAAHPKQTSGSRSSVCTVQLTMTRGVSVPETSVSGTTFLASSRKVVRGASYRRFLSGWRAF